MAKTCEHQFTLGGVVFVDGTSPLPGTGACLRRYYRFFYCTRCLAKRHEMLPQDSHTYEKVLYDATPENARNVQPT